MLNSDAKTGEKMPCLHDVRYRRCGVMIHRCGAQRRVSRFFTAFAEHVILSGAVTKIHSTRSVPLAVAVAAPELVCL